MLKKLKSILFVFCVVMVFTAQTNRPNDKEQKNAPAARPASAARPAPVTHTEQARPQAQVQHTQAPNNDQHRSQILTRREIPQQDVQRQPAIQARIQPARQEWTQPRVRAIPVPASAPVDNNRLFNHQHHNNWQPRYNYYDNQYHFYPYVNIAAEVDLSGGYMVVGPDGQNYYYDRGTFYLQDQSGQYVAVPPPIGIIVNPIAPHARQINVNDQVFYRYKGIFYIQVPQGFQVIGPVQPVPADS